MLDDQEAIIKQDTRGVLQATEMLADQCQQAWDETQSITLPPDYHEITNVVVAGMGGSHLGAQLINSVFRPTLTVPISIQNQYTPAGYVNYQTLVIATSFSGTTEEVLNFVQAAHQKKAKIVCISSGGPLAQIAQENHYPHYNFLSKYNPTRIPRYGYGYAFISQLSFLSKVGVLQFSQSDLDDIVTILQDQKSKFSLSVALAENPAKQLAISLQNRTAMLVASEHLIGSAYIFKNQINESAKQLAVLFEIPELNHHLLEGLARPTNNSNTLSFVFFESDHYYSKNQKRYQITADIIKQQNIPFNIFHPESQSPLTQAFETLAFTSYTAFYLSILNQVDPGPNPWVDYLKEKMKDK